jgi:hypothetical protein
MNSITTVTDLQTLLANMNPSLSQEEYVFCSLTTAQRRALTIEPILEFIESEGIAVVITHDQAQQHGIRGEFLARMITLKVYSSLNAVGFLAAITSRLASHGISVQPVSAFHHDYLFVPADRAREAIEILRDVTTSGASTTPQAVTPPSYQMKSEPPT